LPTERAQTKNCSRRLSQVLYPVMIVMIIITLRYGSQNTL